MIGLCSVSAGKNAQRMHMMGHLTQGLQGPGLDELLQKLNTSLVSWSVSTSMQMSQLSTGSKSKESFRRPQSHVENSRRN